MENHKQQEVKFDKDFFRRCCWLVVGLFVMAFGVALSIKAGIGTTPISSLPYVVSLFTPLSVGMITICMHVFFILLQILILRKDYKPFQLIQFPIAVIFGFLTDFALWVFSWVEPSNYIEQWIVCIIGIIVVGIGVTIEVKSNVTVLAGEGVSLAVCQKTKLKFSTMKIIFDVSLVVTACILSLIFLHGIQGVREGTVVAALCVGLVVKGVNKLLEKLAPSKTADAKI